MKFNCGPTLEEKIESKKQWHPWFAWHPVRVGDRDCRWLEIVERKGTLNHSTFESWWEFEYRS